MNNIKKMAEKLWAKIWKAFGKIKEGILPYRNESKGISSAFEPGMKKKITIPKNRTSRIF
jgi:hypothetical protein